MPSAGAGLEVPVPIRHRHMVLLLKGVGASTGFEVPVPLRVNRLFWCHSRCRFWQNRRFGCRCRSLFSESPSPNGNRHQRFGVCLVPCFVTIVNSCMFHHQSDHITILLTNHLGKTKNRSAFHHERDHITIGEIS